MKVLRFVLEPTSSAARIVCEGLLCQMNIAAGRKVYARTYVFAPLWRTCLCTYLVFYMTTTVHDWRPNISSAGAQPAAISN
jgi:hypothetical protein